MINNLLDKVDTLIIGGGMAYTFLKAKGCEIGDSICEEDKLDLAKELMAKAEKNGVALLLPVDNVVADAFSADAATKVVGSEAIPPAGRGWISAPRPGNCLPRPLPERALWFGTAPWACLS